MIVGDYVFNDNFDTNFNYEIYDCSDTDCSWQELEPVFNSRTSECSKPFSAILDMEIMYVTIKVVDNVATLIIEAKRL